MSNVIGPCPLCGKAGKCYGPSKIKKGYSTFGCKNNHPHRLYSCPEERMDKNAALKRAKIYALFYAHGFGPVNEKQANLKNIIKKFKGKKCSK